MLILYRFRRPMLMRGTSCSSTAAGRGETLAHRPVPDLTGACAWSFPGAPPRLCTFPPTSSEPGAPPTVATRAQTPPTKQRRPHLPLSLFLWFTGIGIWLVGECWWNLAYFGKFDILRCFCWVVVRGLWWWKHGQYVMGWWIAGVFMVKLCYSRTAVSCETMRLPSAVAAG
jgi:hypothetical protein